MPLSLSVFSQSGPPICTPIWAFFRAFKAFRALKGPLIKFSHILMHRPYRDILYLKFSCLYLFPFSHKVVPQKASGGGSGGGVVYHTSTGQYIGVATFFFFFFFFFFESGLKLDEKSWVGLLGSGGAFGVGWALFLTDSGGLGGGPPNRRRRARLFFCLKTSLEALEP